MGGLGAWQPGRLQPHAPSKELRYKVASQAGGGAALLRPSERAPPSSPDRTCTFHTFPGARIEDDRTGATA